MKEVKLDHLGRIVIPVSMRNSLGMKEGARLEIRQTGDYVTVRLAKKACRLCGGSTVVHNEFMVCNTCIQKIKNI